MDRFSSLVQPIKDLASNWDIDIADQLGDYLEELEQLRISMDGGQTQLNFAEAALLIQGSTTVYSKKVEYLHQLVLKSLEYITQKKTAKSNNVGNNKSDTTTNDQSIDDEFLQFSGDASFLLLDNLIEEGQNIDQKHTNSCEGLDQRLSLQSTSQAANMSRVSISLMHSMLNDDHGSSLKLMSASFLDSNGALVLGSFRPSYFKPYVNSDKSDGQSFSSYRIDQQQDSMIIEPADDYVGDKGDWEPQSYDDAEDIAIQQPPQQAIQVPRKPTKNFTLLDPHQVVSGSRPARKGRPFKLPNSYKSEEMPFQTFLIEKLSKQKNGLQEFLNINIPAKGLFEPSLLPLLQLKRKILRRKRMERNFSAPQQVNPLDRSAWEEESNHYQDDREENYFQNDYDDGDFYEPISTQENDEGNLSNNTDRILFPGEKDIADNIEEEEELSRRVDAALHEELNKSKANSYEMICRQYIEGFHRGANAFARETNLSRRVSDWTSRLEPILQAQEEAAPFDIHEYSDNVLSELSSITDEQKFKTKGTKAIDLSSKVAFEDIAQGKSSAEVCRVFLACLQLANLGNVEVDPGTIDEEEHINKQFSLSLLNKSRRKDVEDFLAPSIQFAGNEELLSSQLSQVIEKEPWKANRTGRSRISVR